MLASKMIVRLQKLVDKYGDFQVDMLSPIIENGKIIGEKLLLIRQIKFRKKIRKILYGLYWRILSKNLI